MCYLKLYIYESIHLLTLLKLLLLLLLNKHIHRTYTQTPHTPTQTHTAHRQLIDGDLRNERSHHKQFRD